MADSPGIFPNIKRLFRHSAIYGIGDALGRTIGLVLIPLYTRCLTPEEYGLMSLAYVFIAFTAVFYTLGLNPAFIRFFLGVREKLKRGKVFSTTYSFILLTSLTFSGGIWVLSTSLSKWLFNSPTCALYFKLISVIIFVDTLALFPLLILRALERSKEYASLTLLKFGATVGLNIYFVLILGKGVEGVLISNAITSTLLLLVLLPLALAYFRPTFSPSLLRGLLNFGLPYLPGALSVLVIDLSDRYLLEHFSNLHQVGLYAVGYRFGMIMTLFVTAFRFAWPPFFLSIAEQENAKRVYSRICTYFLLVALFLFLIISIYIEDLMRVLVAPEYWAASRVVPLVLLSYIFYGLYINFMVGVYIEKRTSYIPYITGVAAGVNIGLNILLIPLWGMMGAALATLASYLTMALSLWGVTRGFYPIAYEYGRIGKLALGTALVFGLNLLLPGSHNPWGIGFKGLTLLVFALLLYGMRFFTDDEISRVKAMLIHS